MTTSSRNPLLIFWIALFAIILIVYATQHPPIKFIVLNIVPMIAASCLMASMSGFGSIPVMMLLKERNVATKILTSLALGMYHRDLHQSFRVHWTIPNTSFIV